MADHIAIQIRDQIATQIMATSYSVHTARHFKLQQSQLPAVCVVLGDDSIEEADFGRVEHHEHDFKFNVYAAAAGDVDRELWNAIQTLRELMKTDPQLGGLVDDSFLLTIGEPQKAEGDTKLMMAEVTFRVLYHTD